MNSDELLASARRGASIPNDQNLFTDAELLAFADETIATSFVPMIMSLREEFFVKKENISCVANQAEYNIPPRAIGSTLRDLKLIVGSERKNLIYIQPEVSHKYATSGEPIGFYMQGDQYVLVPVPTSASYSLEISYSFRPSALVPLASAGVVATIGSGLITVTSLPSGILTGVLVDCVSGSANYQNKGYNVAVTNVSGSTVYGTFPSTLAVGDYVCLASTSPVIQLPLELHPAVAQSLQCRYLEAVGDYEGLRVAENRLQQQMTTARQLLSPRIEGEGKFIINRSGLINRNQRRGFR